MKIRFPGLPFFVMGFVLALPPRVLLGQTDQKAAVEKLKTYVKAIDDRTETSFGPIRRFDARPGKNGTWEWKEFKSKEEAQFYFQGAGRFREAFVYSKNGNVFCVAYSAWSDSGDWDQSVDYYFDDAERIISIQSDFRSFIGGVKVIQSEYFDSEGKNLGVTVTYHKLISNEVYPKKPEYLPDLPVPIFLKVSDLPFYSLLREPASKGLSQ